MGPQDELSQRRWWLKDPAELDESDPSFLCEICRHIDFHYMLFSTPLYAIPEDSEILLGTYSEILKRQACAFCRLIKSAIDNGNDGDDDFLPEEHEGKPVRLSMVSVSTTFVQSDPRQLILWAKPDPQRKKDKAMTSRTIHLVNEGWEVGNSRRGRQINLEQLDYVLALYWIRTCRMGYGLHKNESNDEEELEWKKRLPPNFRLVDVEEMRVVVADPSMEYVTLSYVWPKTPQLKLQIGNQNEIMGLDRPLDRTDFSDRIPQTIKDAMEICRRTADRYLWVDALCIIQDDDRVDGDRAIQIQAMDAIYGSSVLTIAATCGEGAEACLPGVRPGTRKIKQRAEIIQGHRLCNRPFSFENAVTESKWNTRAWTLQERVLSRRKLFITPQQMFFQCEHTPSRMEEDSDLSPQARKSVTYAMDDTGTDQIPIRWSVNTLTYERTVQNFTSRDITKKCDILNAFRGIEGRMKTIFRSGFLYGLPQSELEYCLMWEPVEEIKRRVCPDTNCTNLGCPSPNSLEPIFPSWSWAGWEGPVTYHPRERLCRVRWAERGPDTGSPEQTFTSAEYRAPSSHDGAKVDESKWWNEWQQDKDNSGVRFFRHSSDPDVWFRNPTAHESRPGPNCDPENSPYLRFETQTHDLEIPEEWNSQSTAIRWAQMTGTTTTPLRPTWEFSLTNDDGKVMGYYRMPTSLANELSHKKKYALVRIARVGHYLSYEEIRKRKDKSKDTRPLPEPPSFVEKGILAELEGDRDVLAEPASYPDEVSTADAAEYLPFDRQRYDAYKPLCMYEVLFVERIGGVAFRLGVGMVHVDGWAQEKPKTEIVVLG